MTSRKLVLLVLALSMQGCPTSGDAPAYVGYDAGNQHADTDAGDDPCVDYDGDGYVVNHNCSLPGGDCAPRNPLRHPGATEICNGVDENCDGQIDEDSVAPDPCTPLDANGHELKGECAKGVMTCQAGEIICKALIAQGTREICDGLDNDCDGLTDEDTSTGRDCVVSNAFGICRDGIETCGGAAGLKCKPKYEPGEQFEVCDGQDNDCDGLTDEDENGNPLTSDEPCEVPGRLGKCAVGWRSCTGGEWKCIQKHYATSEICNGEDDDCDGLTDEDSNDSLDGYGAQGGGNCTPLDSNGRELKGECSKGVQKCSGARVQCMVLHTPIAELCDGLDNDCDGQTDEDWIGDACTVPGGLGECAKGLFTCQHGRETCTPQEPSEEKCDGLDNDCDGLTDEASDGAQFPELGAEGGLNCTLNNGLNGMCGIGLTSCAACDEGDETCVNGKHKICVEHYIASEEKCDGLDNDCDGLTDEDFTDLNKTCSVGQGYCRTNGRFICASDHEGVTCNATPRDPLQETDFTCNNRDDDCDGLTDEGALCNPSEIGLITNWRFTGNLSECEDFNGDGKPDNGLSVELQNRLKLLSTTAYKDLPVLISIRDPQSNQIDLRSLNEQALNGGELDVKFSLIEGQKSGNDFETLRQSLDAQGLPRATISAKWDGQELHAQNSAKHLVKIPSPFFRSSDAKLSEFTTLTLDRLSVKGTVIAHENIYNNQVPMAYELRISGLASQAQLTKLLSVLDARGHHLEGIDEGQFTNGAFESLFDDPVAICFFVSSPQSDLPIVHQPKEGGQACSGDEAELPCYGEHTCNALITYGDNSYTVSKVCGPMNGELELGAACYANAECGSGYCQSTNWDVEPFVAGYLNTADGMCTDIELGEFEL